MHASVYMYKCFNTEAENRAYYLVAITSPREDADGDQVLPHILPLHNFIHQLQKVFDGVLEVLEKRIQW